MKREKETVLRAVKGAQGEKISALKKEKDGTNKDIIIELEEEKI